ncbi:MAG TPA: endonuclease III [Holophagaceae bacterium]|nr:endonuclease III [Holophagaceae bacterium]
MAKKALPATELMDRLAAAYPDARCALDHRNPFELVVATILSAQCTDARVNLTTPALFARFPDPASLAAADPTEVEALVKSTGFFRNKAKSIQGLAQRLTEEFNGVLPSDPDLLASLPGVGQKTANVVLANAFNVPALAVDTHIFRVARRLGLSKASTPEKVEADLCRLFPREAWIPLHHQLIFHGRRTCDARQPDCEACPLLDLCPTGLGKIKDPHSGKKLSVGDRKLEERSPAPLQRSASRPEPHAGPARIVSLVPSVTELLVQWGLATRIVGRSRYCIAPKWIRATVPAVGGTKDPDLEAIRGLAPDLVILETDENPKAVADALTALGLPWLALEVRTVADCAKAWVQLGQVLGREAEAQARATALKALLKGRSRKAGPRALTLIWRDPWMSAGPDTYVADLARQAGFRPVGPDRYPALSEAEIEALAPDVILLPTEPFRFNARHRAELRKRFPEAEVHLVDGQAMTWYLSRTEEGLERLRNLATSGATGSPFTP